MHTTTYFVTHISTFSLLFEGISTKKENYLKRAKSRLLINLLIRRFKSVLLAGLITVFGDRNAFKHVDLQILFSN